MNNTLYDLNINAFYLIVAFISMNFKFINSNSLNLSNLNIKANQNSCEFIIVLIFLNGDIT